MARKEESSRPTSSSGSWMMEEKEEEEDPNNPVPVSLPVSAPDGKDVLEEGGGGWEALPGCWDCGPTWEPEGKWEA